MVPQARCFTSRRDHPRASPSNVTLGGEPNSQNLVLVRSRYRQPFGTFSGTLPGGIALGQGYGVMEDHDAWW